MQCSSALQQKKGLNSDHTTGHTLKKVVQASMAGHLQFGKLSPQDFLRKEMWTSEVA